ncbi:MAG: hypothetical protein O7A08_15180, partial [SAR324 cluster bacterium]|nr:hypothetical protein [SAR324 cluster bacterium]
MRFSLSIITLLALLAGTVQAQVAAPPLQPLFGGTTDNPAAMQWAGYSFAGGAVFSGDQTATDSAGAPIPAAAADVDAALAELRVVFDSFSFGATVVNFEFKGSGFAGESTETAVGFAFLIGDMFSFGLGVENAEDKETFGGPVIITEFSLPVAGISVRLGEVIFLGVSGGTETATGNFFTGEFKRNVRRAGVALYTAPGNFQTHLEVYAEARDPFVTSATDFSNDTKLTGMMAEILWGSFLLAVNATSETEKGFDSADTPPQEDLEIKATIVTVG